MEAQPEFSALRAELISHLSKEIEVLSTNMISTRLKAAFTIWIGPYILLGALLIRPQQTTVAAHLDLCIVGLLVTVSAFYLLMAYVAGSIERYVAAKCNEWRDLIARLSLEAELDIKEVKRLSQDADLQKSVLSSYIYVWLIMFLSFAAILFIVIHTMGISPTWR